MRPKGKPRHTVEVDQSGKVEQTESDTVVAFSNGIQSALLVPAAVKRACQKELRERGVAGNMVSLRLFAAALLVLVEGWTAQIDALRLDTEYEGKDGEIKGLLAGHLRGVGGLAAEGIAFVYVGKHSPAHSLAWQVRRGTRRPDRVADLADLSRYC